MGVISLHGAPLSLHAFYSFPQGDFSTCQWKHRSHPCHTWVARGREGPWETGAYWVSTCSGPCGSQDVLFRSSPLSLPPKPKARQMEPGLTCKKLLPRVEGWPPHPHANSSRTRVKAPGGILHLHCPIAINGGHPCM